MSSGDGPEEFSPGTSRGTRTKAPSRSGAAEEDTNRGDADGFGAGGAGRRTQGTEGGSVADVVNGRSSLMFLDVEEEIGAAGMVGSSEWLLRYVGRRKRPACSPQADPVAIYGAKTVRLGPV